MPVEPLTHRLLRRSGGGGLPARRPLSGLADVGLADVGLAPDTEQFAGRWIALLDDRVVANDESPAGLMRKIWESQFPVDDVRVQFVDAPLSGPATFSGPAPKVS
jgi:hypothetical protein